MMSEQGKLDFNFDVDQISQFEYNSKQPLILPFKSARGVYGGNLVGQALLVAMKSSPNDRFRPHSLHSYFISACNNQDLVKYKVEHLSNGKSFVNRSVRAYQREQLVYIANVSLTIKNTNAKGEKKIYQFETPQFERLSNEEFDSIPVSEVDSHLNIYYKFPKKFVSLNESCEENDQSVAERRLSFYSKWGKEVSTSNGQMKYVGLTNLADSGYLTSLTRLLRIEDFPIERHRDLYFLVSLDHTMYFHDDDDWDLNDWINIQFKAVRFNYDRVLFEGELFNRTTGKHIATYIQEGLVKLNGIEEKAKL